MNKRGFLFFFKIMAVTVIFTFFSCGQVKNKAEFSETLYEMDSNFTQAEPKVSMKQEAEFSVADTDESSSFQSAEPVAAERKLIQTARLRLSSPHTAELSAQLQTKIDEFRGFTESLRQSSTPEQVTTSIDMTVKIPAEKFADFLAYLDTNTKVIEKSLQTQDVTDRYYDLESRVKNREILLQTYRGYLSTAKVMKDILDVDDRINSLTYEIEQMKGSLLSLDRSIRYSTVTLSIFNSDIQTPSSYSLLTRVKNFVSNITDFFLSSIFIILYGAIVGTVLILLAALVFYITFGKLGLVKKLFKRLK